MILAAGMGTRLKPITDSIPKALVPVLGKPLLERVIDKLKAAGFDEIIINIHHFADQIIEFVEYNNNFGIRIEFSDERKKLLDTGGAVKKAQWFFNKNEPVLIHNVDILSTIDLSDVFQQHIINNVLATLVVSSRETFRYLLFDKNDNLQGWTNEKTGEIKSPYSNFNTLNYTKLAFSGIHVISGDAIQYMKSFSDKFSIIDFYLSLCNKLSVQSYLTNTDSMIDVGKLDSLKKAEEFLNLRDTE